MANQLCMPVEYLYRRKPMPKSRLWHLNCYKAEKPSVLSPEIMDITDPGGDQVSITIAVPCDDQGNVDSKTHAEYQARADQKFMEIRADAELA